VPCPVDGVGRVQRVWEGWGDERRREVTGEESERERGKEGERERERERESERESEAGAEARTGVYR